MLAAVNAVHDHDIVHCDLKPHNFILFRRRSKDHPEEIGTGGASVLFEHEKYMLKLSDFGLSRQLEDSATHVSEKFPIGTVRYMAPEVVHDCRSNSKLWVGKAADIWSIGVILHQMSHQGLTPHSHVECRGNKLRLLLAIADEKSARVKSSCPRLLLTSQPSTPVNENAAARLLASARHATLITLQSLCLQFFPKKRANTQHLVSVTEEKKRLFFGSVKEQELLVIEGGPTDNTTDSVGGEDRQLLLRGVGKIDHGTGVGTTSDADAEVDDTSWSAKLPATQRGGEFGGPGRIILRIIVVGSLVLVWNCIFVLSSVMPGGRDGEEHPNGMVNTGPVRGAGPGPLWGVPNVDPADVERVFSEEGPVWEVFYQCECVNADHAGHTVIQNGSRRWITRFLHVHTHLGPIFHIISPCTSPDTISDASLTVSRSVSHV